MTLLFGTRALVRSFFANDDKPSSAIFASRRRREIRSWLETLERRELFSGSPPTVMAVSKALHFNQSLTFYTFAAGDFAAGFSDVNAGDSLQAITIASLPVQGILELDGRAVAAGQVLQLRDIGHLTYQFADGAVTYLGNDTFTWNGSDGTSYAAAPADFNLTLTDQAPTVAEISKGVDENSSPRFSTGDFTSAFIDADAGDTLTEVQLTSLPAHGMLSLLGDPTPLPLNGTPITVSDLANLVYTPTAGYTGTDTFTWKGADSQQFSASIGTVALAINPVPEVTILGGGLIVANGATLTTPDNFTDFGAVSIAGAAAGRTTQRTFTLFNGGAGTVTLAAASSLTISGANAGEFKLVAAPASAIAAGQSTTFTIQFTPKGAGGRSATVTLTDVNGTSYNFAIQGTGLKMKDVVVQDPATKTKYGSVQVATTTAGSGSAAREGDRVTISYTATILNYPATDSAAAGLEGTVFDSTAGEGSVPLSFNLGVGQVIRGWDNGGLAGIQAGETRTLIVPSSAAYGDSGFGILPAKAVIVYTIHCLTIMPATAVVEGNLDANQIGVAITAGASEPTPANGTDFGVLSAGQTSATATFALTNSTLASLAYGKINVKVNGANARDFIVTQLAPDATNTQAQFTVTFKPTGSGVRTATIHVLTSDPTTPDYTFTVQGSTAVDLAVSTAATKFPSATIIAGSSTRLTMPVVVKNNSFSTLPKGSTTDVTVYLHNTATNSDTPLQLNNGTLSLAGIGGNKSKQFKLPVTIPSDIGAGTYSLIAIVNAGLGITETDNSNNIAATEQTITVAPATYDLTGALKSTTLRSGALNAHGKVSLNIISNGNVMLAKNQQVTVTILAHNTGTGADVTLTSSMLTLGALKPGKLKAANVAVRLADVLAAGNYVFEARIDPVPALAESNVDNNLLTQTSAGGALSLISVG